MSSDIAPEKSYWVYDDFTEYWECDGRTTRRRITGFLEEGLQIELRLERLREKGGQPTTVFYKEDREKILAYAETKGIRKTTGDSPMAAPLTPSAGVFYITQLVPDLLPERVKMGYSADLDRRMGELRCSAPTLTVLKTYPCKAEWEKAALAVLMNGQSQKGPEVIDTADLNALIARADQFFAMFNAASG
jgi:hypothetical protein